MISIFRRTFVLVVWRLAWSLVVLQTSDANNPSPIKFTVANRCGHDISISWVNQDTRKAHLMTNLKADDIVALDSFLGHEFEIQELPLDASSSSSSCSFHEDGICRKSSFVIAFTQDHAIIVNPDIKLETKVKDATAESPTSMEEYPTSIDECSMTAADRLLQVQSSSSSSSSTESQLAITKWKDCAESYLANELQLVGEEIQFHSLIRHTLAHSMENFTCIDPHLDSSPDIEQREWISERDHQKRMVHVKLEQPSSRIHVVNDFATEDECLAVDEAAQPFLRSAPVSDGKGGAHVDVSRKALQAGITPDWSLEAEGDLIARLSRRVYDYVNHVLHMNITEHGQEPIMSIQYFGRGYNDTEPDRYTPHCDDQCDGTIHNPGTRMATMVIYCKIPEGGGHTNFQNAGIHVKPTLGSAVFFGYIDPETMRMDLGLTTHSGCPVYEGEKKIVTQWVRYGVDAETPWTDLNGFDVKIADDESQ